MSTHQTVARHDNVLFHFRGGDGDVELPGTVMIREFEMVLDIPGGSGPFLIRGVLCQTWWEGANVVHSRRPEVTARWAYSGREYVGIWLEDGLEWFFSFVLQHQRT